MNFEKWKGTAAHKLEDEFGIDARHIPDEVWCQFYDTNHAPRDAAERIAMLFVKGPLRRSARTRRRLLRR